MITQLIPKDYNRVANTPEDREGTIPFAKQTEGSMAFLMTYPIDDTELMPYNNLHEVINGIHNCLDVNQGLIDVNAQLGNSKKGYVVYSIIKAVDTQGCSGVTYTLRLHIVAKEKWEILGFFQEYGMTGMRDTTVFSFLEQNNKIAKDKSNWSRDPFDENYKQGICMNLSELESFDEAFPNHPLTQCRQLISHIINNL